jgi:mannose-6-phosphate isomerase-like protein (cupin superfamily)
MIVRNLFSCPLFLAGDKTELREILNGRTESLDLRYSLAHARLEPGRTSILHILKSCEVYYMLAGKGRMEIDGESQAVHPGDTVVIPPRSKQRIESLGPDYLEFLCIVDPAWQAEDEELTEGN